MDTVRAMIVRFLHNSSRCLFRGDLRKVLTGDKRERVARCLAIASRAVALYS